MKPRSLASLFCGQEWLKPVDSSFESWHGTLLLMNARLGHTILEAAVRLIAESTAAV